MAKTEAPVWRNAIVGYRLVPPDQLLANPRNPRRHPNVQRDALRASLRELGWVLPVLQNVRTGHLIDGHARIEEALSAGVPEVPVIDVDLSPEQEAMALATLDPIAAMASRDREALDLLLREIDTGEQALMDLLAREAVMVGLTPPDDPLAEWQGMPEFDQEDADSFDCIKVHFANAEDRAAFLSVMGEDPERRKSIWYPKREYEKQDA
jgi:hypothetical protein